MIKAGASISLYGLLGIVVGYTIINWPSLSIIGAILKAKLITTVVLLLIFMLLFTNVAVTIDFLGYLGSFMAGIFVSGLLEPIAG